MVPRNVPEMLDAIYAQMKTNSITKTKSIRKGDRITHQDEVNEALDIIDKVTTVYDKRNGRVIGFDDNLILDFNKNLVAEISHNMRETIKIHLEQSKKKGYSREDIASLLVLIFQFDAAYIFDTKYRDMRTDILQYISDGLMQNDQEVTNEIDAGIYFALLRTRDLIPHGPQQFEGYPYAIDFEKEKSMVRAFLVSDLMDCGIIDYRCLELCGEITKFTFDEIDCAFRQRGLLTKEELFDTLLAAGHFNNIEEIKEYYFNFDKKFFYSIADATDIVSRLVVGRFDTPESKKNKDKYYALKSIKIKELAEVEPDLLEELFSMQNLPKNDFIEMREKEGGVIRKEFLDLLDREKLTRLLFSKTVKYKVAYTSQELIDLYGRLKFEDLEKLVEKGSVNLEDMIGITRYEELIHDYGEQKKLADFYDLSKLEILIKEGKLSKKFAERFNKYLEETLSPEDRIEYFKKMFEDMKDKPNRDELLVSLLQHGINVEKVDETQIMPESIESLFLDEKITNPDILTLYKKGFIDITTLSGVLTNEEILECYRRGELDYTCIALLSNKTQAVSQEYKENRLSLAQVMELYSMDDGLDIETVKEMLADRDLTEESIGELLPDTINPEKVEELFKNYIISHDDLTELVARGIISSEEADRMAKELISHEAYEGLFADSGVAILTKETEAGESRTPSIPTRRGKKATFKVDPFLQEMLLDEIGFDERRLVLRGYNNSLNGYTVFLSEPNGVVTFVNLDKPNNATYIMTLQQAMFFLRNIRRSTTSNVVEASTTKRELRETEHVKVRNTSGGWGRNVVDTIAKLSPEFRTTYRRDKEYKKGIDGIVQMIKSDYDMRRE